MVSRGLKELRWNIQNLISDLNKSRVMDGLQDAKEFYE
jgi:hypothetical protein